MISVLIQWVAILFILQAGGVISIPLVVMTPLSLITAICFFITAWNG